MSDLGNEVIDNRRNLYDLYLDAEQEAIEHYNNDPLFYQQQALAEAVEAGHEINSHLSGVFDVVTRVSVIPVPEKPVEIPTPEDCVSKDDLLKIASEFGFNPRAVGTAWTRLMQRAAHKIEVPEEGLSPEDTAKIEALKQAGIRVYSYGYEGITAKRLDYYYYYTFRAQDGRDIELLRLPDGVEEDSPYHENERFVVSSALVRAVDEGWLERANDDDDEAFYPPALGPKSKRLFKGLAERLRQVDVDELAVKLELGYANLDEIAAFAQQNGMNPNLVPRVNRVIKRIAGDSGKVSEYVIRNGRWPQRYMDDDMFPTPADQEETVELVTEDGVINIDTLQRLCYTGSFKSIAQRIESYGDKTDQIVWGFLEHKRKEAIRAPQR